MDQPEDEVTSPIIITSTPGQPLCRVCGNRSSGIHYGVVACEGCKAFYKRGLTKAVDYKCYFGGLCVIGPTTGGRCKACRYQKCLKAGMSLHATRMGRTPRRLTRHGNDQLSLSKNGSGAQSAIRQIAPAPTNLRSDFPYALRQDRFGKWTTQTSVIQKIPSRAAVQPFGGQLMPYISSRPPSEASDGSPEESPLGAGTVDLFQRSISRPSFVLLHDLNGIARFRPDTLWSLRGFGLSPGLPSSSARWVPSDLVPSLMQNLSGDVVSLFPPFLGDYWQGLRAETLCVERTICTVANAVNTVYGRDCRLHDILMQDALVDGLVPHQPQCTRETMLAILREAQVDMLQKQCRFMMLMQGFSDLSPSDQRVLVKERWFETWMIVNSPYIENNELFYLMGDDGLHFSSYWAHQFFANDYLYIALELVTELKNLRLNVVEQFLLLIVATFNPDTTTAEDKTSLSFLHAHYLDCLLQSIRSRQSLTERVRVVEHVRRFMSKFRLLYRISTLYVAQLDWHRIPVVAMKHGVALKIADILTAEQDGLKNKMPMTGSDLVCYKFICKV